MSDEIAVSVKNIDFSYDTKKIYEHLSVDFPKDRISFIMGENGSGKTTLLKIVCNFLQPKDGEINILGKNIKEYDARGLAKVIAYVPQIINLNNDFLVKDYLVLGRSPYISFGGNPSESDYTKVEKYAQLFAIDDLLNTNFNTLSGGQKQIAAIVRAMVQETPIIILDEPMSALDMGKQAEFLSMILKLQKEGKTIILTSHNINHALAIRDNCEICLIHEQKMIGFGSCSEVLSEDNILAIYGDNVELDQNGNINFRIKAE